MLPQDMPLQMFEFHRGCWKVIGGDTMTACHELRAEMRRRSLKGTVQRDEYGCIQIKLTEVVGAAPVSSISWTSGRLTS